MPSPTSSSDPHDDDPIDRRHGSYNSFTGEHHDPHADDHLPRSQRDKLFPTFRHSEPVTYTEDEREALRAYDRKLKSIRTAVRGVVKGFKPGTYVWGDGGTAKSYTVEHELKKLKCDYVPFNTRVTGKGLFRLIQEHPHETIFIEDAETLFADKLSHGVLRGALWSQSKSKPMKRPVTWTTDKGTERVVFTGGLIIVANEKVSDRHPLLKAAMTRIDPLELTVSNAEIKALMKRICASGHEVDGEIVLTPEQCWEVGQFIIKNSEGKPLNLRDLVKGFQSRHQYESDESELHWHEIVLAGLAKTAGATSTRGGDNDEKDRIAVMVDAAPISGSEKLDLWKQWTKRRFKLKEGFGRDAYYSALKRARAKPGFEEMALANPGHGMSESRKT